MQSIGISLRFQQKSSTMIRLALTKRHHVKPNCWLIGEYSDNSSADDVSYSITQTSHHHYTPSHVHHAWTMYEKVTGIFTTCPHIQAAIDSSINRFKICINKHNAECMQLNIIIRFFVKHRIWQYHRLQCNCCRNKCKHKVNIKIVKNSAKLVADIDLK